MLATPSMWCCWETRLVSAPPFCRNKRGDSVCTPTHSGFVRALPRNHFGGFPGRTSICCCSPPFYSAWGIIWWPKRRPPHIVRTRKSQEAGGKLFKVGGRNLPASTVARKCKSLRGKPHFLCGPRRFLFPQSVRNIPPPLGPKFLAFWGEFKNSPPQIQRGELYHAHINFTSPKLGLNTTFIATFFCPPNEILLGGPFETKSNTKFPLKLGPNANSPPFGGFFENHKVKNCLQKTPNSRETRGEGPLKFRQTQMV